MQIPKRILLLLLHIKFLRSFGFYNFNSTFVVKHLKSKYSGILHYDVTE